MLLTFLHIYRRIVLSPCVPMKMAGCFTSKAALTTFERHFSRMLEFVCSQIIISIGRIVALITLERLLSCMFPCVSFKVTSRSAGIVTL